MYQRIYDFCKVRNRGTIYNNDPVTPPPRVQFLIDLLHRESIPFELDRFNVKKTVGYNIILRGTSNRMVVAHHDVLNPEIDNANDNSASVINAIMVKKLMPQINVVLLDGEEAGGLGSQRCSDLINGGKFGKIDWVLNLELSGRGGKYFFIGDYPGKLSNHIKSIFDCPSVITPFNDSVTFRRNGIDSVVINPLPVLIGETSHVKWRDDVYLDWKLLLNCHRPSDTIETISVSDMKDFVEGVVVPILT
jgi:hypothetical protein